MRAYIGPYAPYWSSSGVQHYWYQLRYKKHKYDVTPDRLDRAIEAVLRGWNVTVNRLVNVTFGNRARRIRIHVHDYDVWNAEHTLATIIHPVLVRLREQQHGAPFTEDEDVPVELRSNGMSEEVDDSFFLRWNWILGEMIWAFEQLTADHDDDFFHDGAKTDKVPIGWQWVGDDLRGFWVDRAGEDARNKRIENGLRLFAKYYRGLWD